MTSKSEIKRIAMPVSAGGHLTEIMKIVPDDVTENRKVIIFTERSPRTEKLKFKTHFFKPLENNPLDYPPALIKAIYLLKREKIDLVISTGAQIALPFFIAAKLIGIKTVFIETITRPKIPTLAAKICYFFSSIFLVQNDGMQKHYGRRAIYRGGII